MFNNKTKVFHDHDRIYSISVYIIYAIFTIYLMLSQNDINILHGNWLLTYYILSSVSLLLTTVCFIFTLFKKKSFEIIGLIFLISTLSILLLEKTFVFMIDFNSLLLSIYIEYISLTSLVLIFTIHRFNKLKKLIQLQKEYDDIILEHEKKKQTWGDS